MAVEGGSMLQYIDRGLTTVSAVLNQGQTTHFVRMMSLVMADQLRTVVLNSVGQYMSLWEAYDFSHDSPAAQAGTPPQREDGSYEVHKQN